MKCVGSCEVNMSTVLRRFPPAEALRKCCGSSSPKGRGDRVASARVVRVTQNPSSPMRRERRGPGVGPRFRAPTRPFPLFACSILLARRLHRRSPGLGGVRDRTLGDSAHRPSSRGRFHARRGMPRTPTKCHRSRLLY